MRDRSSLNSGLVRKSTLWLAVLAAFCAGLLGGIIASGLTRQEEETVSKQPLFSQDQDRSQADHRNTPEFKRLEQAVRDDPKNAPAWTALGNWLYDHDLPAEAVRAYEASLIIKPNNPDVMTDLGVMYRRLGQYEKAVDLFAKAGAVAPDHLQSRFNHGVVLFYDLRREQDALRIWSELLRRAPEYRTPDGKRLADLVKQAGGLR